MRNKFRAIAACRAALAGPAVLDGGVEGAAKDKVATRSELFPLLSATASLALFEDVDLRPLEPLNIFLAIAGVTSSSCCAALLLLRDKIETVDVCGDDERPVTVEVGTDLPGEASIVAAAGRVARGAATTGASDPGALLLLLDLGLVPSAITATRFPLEERTIDDSLCLTAGPTLTFLPSSSAILSIVKVVWVATSQEAGVKIGRPHEHTLLDDSDANNSEGDAALFSIDFLTGVDILPVFVLCDAATLLTEFFS